MESMKALKPVYIQSTGIRYETGDIFKVPIAKAQELEDLGQVTGDPIAVRVKVEDEKVEIVEDKEKVVISDKKEKKVIDDK